MSNIDSTSVGITTTVPIEAVYAAGLKPVDLNNLFIAESPALDIEEAEMSGFPRSFCAWAKGLYGTIKRLGIKTIIGVTAGDCSDTHGLCEVLMSEGVRVIPFAYPFEPNSGQMKAEIEKLCSALDTTYELATQQKDRLDSAREKVFAVDRLAYTQGGVSAAEQFDILINASDFGGNPEKYAAKARAILDQSLKKPGHKKGPRLGVIGIPPVFSDLFNFLEGRGANIVFHEFPRQYALPYLGESLEDSYTLYTYPYPVKGRIEDIKREIENRKLDGLVHYVQSFCHRQVYDRLLREELSIPMLTIEGDRPGEVDGPTATRLEAFLETLSGI